MYRKFQRKPQPISTHPLEQELDKSYASMQSQLELVDKLQRIFGQMPSDPVIRFQIQKIKKGLSDDIKRLAFTGTDIHQLQEQFGAEMVRGQLVQARKNIDSEKDSHNGQLTDLINDDQFADAYHKANQAQFFQDPLLQNQLQQHIALDVLENPSRLALQDFYIRQGMPTQKAFNKSVRDYKQYQLRDKDSALVSLLEKGFGKLSDASVKQLSKDIEKIPEVYKDGYEPPEELQQQMAIAEEGVEQRKQAQENIIKEQQRPEEEKKLARNKALRQKVIKMLLKEKRQQFMKEELKKREDQEITDLLEEYLIKEKKPEKEEEKKEELKEAEGQTSVGDLYDLDVEQIGIPARARDMLGAQSKSIKKNLFKDLPESFWTGKHRGISSFVKSANFEQTANDARASEQYKQAKSEGNKQKQIDIVVQAINNKIDEYEKFFVKPQAVKEALREILIYKRKIGE